MADTLVLETSAFGRESSSLSGPTNVSAGGGIGRHGGLKLRSPLTGA